MELTIQLEDGADVSLMKKILKQIKGIKTVEVSDEDKTYSWEEIENSEAFSKVIEQSRNQIKNGEYEEFSDELIDSIFNTKK